MNTAIFSWESINRHQEVCSS